MEYESTLTIASRSVDDLRIAFDTVAECGRRVTAHVWRTLLSYDEPDNFCFVAEIDRILFWTPEDRECKDTMKELAGILGEEGFAELVMRNSVSPDCHDYKVTTPGGSCISGYDKDNRGDEFTELKKRYEDDLIRFYCSKIKGYEELWTEDRQLEPPVPYKRESKPARSHEQVMDDDHRHRISEESVQAFRDLLSDPRDLSGTYEKFRKQFETMMANDARMDAEDVYIVLKPDAFRFNNALYERVSLRTRLERAEDFSFYGKIFHIHGHSLIINIQSVNIDPEMKALLCEAEENLRVAIARRGGIIDDYDYKKLKYTDCCVMIDNEDQRYGNWSDKFSGDVNHYGLELISRMAVWYAIIRTPELPAEKIRELQEGSYYLDAVEAKNERVLEAIERVKAEEEERGRQYEIQRGRDFEEIMKRLKEMYAVKGASNGAQIERELDMKEFKALSYWSFFEKYIKEKYGTTANAYLKAEGIIRKN